MKKRKSRWKHIIVGAMAPTILLMFMLFQFVFSINIFFGENAVSELLSESENTLIIEETKENIKKQSKFKDYYGTDKIYELEYQYVLGYVKYINSMKDYTTNTSKEYSLNELRGEVDEAIKSLLPKFKYKKDKIITKTEYKVPIVNEEGMFVGYQIIVITDEETADFLTSANTIKGNYEITYTVKSSTTTKNGNKVTITKPVLESIKQIDKPWDGLRKIIKDINKEEDLEKAIEVIIASSAVFVYTNGDIEEDLIDSMLYTGGGMSTVIGENFSGDNKEFIEKVVVGAKKSWQKHNILPSITIAQAILESAWGRSGLTQKANNLFGIKAFSDWRGQYIEMLTREYTSDGIEYWIPAKFRAYVTWDDCIEDHSKVLLQSNFTAVRNATNYREAAEALVQGGYATDPAYAQLIISIIEQYRLFQYDLQ